MRVLIIKTYKLNQDITPFVCERPGELIARAFPWRNVALWLVSCTEAQMFVVYVRAGVRSRVHSVLLSRVSAGRFGEDTAHAATVVDRGVRRFRPSRDELPPVAAVRLLPGVHGFPPRNVVLSSCLHSLSNLSVSAEMGV